MTELIGAFVVIVGLLGLFALDRIRKVETSIALWIPVVWLFIAGSRPLSFWLFPGMGDTTDRYIEGSPFDRNVLTVLIVAALIVLGARGRKVGTLLRANTFILLFLFYCGLSAFWSDFPDVAFKRWIRVVGDIAIVLVVLTDARPVAALKGLLARAGFLIIPASIVFDLGRGAIGREYHFGLTTNKNMFGQISMVLGLGALWNLLAMLQDSERTGRRKRLIAHGCLVVMSMWCIWSSNSATSAGCFLLGSILIVVTNRWPFSRKPMVLHVLTASMALVALYATIVNPDIGIASAIGKDPTLTGRTDVWRAVISMTPSPWFGAGFESFWLGSRLTKLWDIFPWHPNEAHDGYLEMYLNLGWIGLILFSLVMIQGYRRLVAGFGQYTGTVNLRMAYFVVTLVYNLTEAGFRMFTPMWIFLLLSITPVLKQQPESATSEPINATSWELLEPSLRSSDALQ
jgi:exopolysaccharide production protein ExoQ